MEGCSNIDPLVLPPSPRAVVYHGLRFYRQIKVWLLLMNTDCDPMNWGWKMKNGSFLHIMTGAEPGLQDLLEMIQCNWKESCDKRSKGWLGMLQLVRWMSSCFCDNAMNEQNIDGEIEDYFPGTFQMLLIKNSKLF